MKFDWRKISFAELDAIGVPCMIDGDSKTVNVDVSREACKEVMK